MSHPDPFAYIRAILTTESSVAKRHENEMKRTPLVITISRDYGALGEAIAEKLRQCLNIPLYQNDLLERVAQKAKVSTSLFQQHDEKVASEVSTFINSLIFGAPAHMESYRRALYDVVLEIAGKGGIIVGRGAHLILEGKPVFRLRIVGSKKPCAERVAAELNIPYAAAEKQVVETNQVRNASIAGLFKDQFPDCSLDCAGHFDLVINTDHISADGALPIILLALRQAGFELPSPPQ
jgi:hypothetical protein